MSRTRADSRRVRTQPRVGLGPRVIKLPQDTLPESFDSTRSSRRMKKVPEVLGQLGSLTRLGLRSNGIVALTGDSLPPNVVHLILTDNAIASIDDAAYARLTRAESRVTHRKSLSVCCRRRLCDERGPTGARACWAKAHAYTCTWGRFLGVRKLMLANNALTSFTGGANPARNLRSLELLRLANNELSELP